MAELSVVEGSLVDAETTWRPSHGQRWGFTVGRGRGKNSLASLSFCSLISQCQAPQEGIWRGSPGAVVQRSQPSMSKSGNKGQSEDVDAQANGE